MKMTNPQERNICGESSFGIDNHFQLLLYTTENHCQLEIAKIMNSL